MSPRQRMAIGVAVAALAALGLFWHFGSGSSDSKRRERAERNAKERGSNEDPELEPDDPSDPDEPEQLAPPSADATAVETTGDPTATATTTAAAAPRGTTPAAPPSGSQKVDEMHRLVHQEAIRNNWVPVDENDNPCPPDQIRIVYSPPSNLKQYTKGAYFEPLGPSPDDGTVEVNGLLICEGYPYLYRGFEAYYRPDSGRWDVFPFPVIE